MDDYKRGSKEWGGKSRKQDSRKRKGAFNIKGKKAIAAEVLEAEEKSKEQAYTKMCSMMACALGELGLPETVDPDFWPAVDRLRAKLAAIDDAKELLVEFSRRVNRVSNDLEALAEHKDPLVERVAKLHGLTRP